MKIVDTLSHSVNYGVTSVDHTVKKIVSNPGTVKKILQIGLKVFEAVDLLYHQESSNGELKHSMKGTVDIIGFYSTYKNIIYWMNLFSKETIDQEALEKSISETLCESKKEPRNLKRQQDLAKKVFAEVMAKKGYHSQGEVRKEIQAVLERNGYASSKAEQAANRIIVQQKGRPTIQLFYMACFTTAELGGNILNLQKWHILDLSKLAVSIGSQSRVFGFVVNLGAGFTLGVIASAGLALVVVEKSYETVIIAVKYNSAVDEKEREEAYKELSGALFDLSVNTADLAAAALPMLFVLSPPTIIGLALVSKGIGLVRILSR